MIVFLLLLITVAICYSVFVLVSINDVLQIISIDISRIVFKMNNGDRLGDRFKSAVQANKGAERDVLPELCPKDYPEDK